MKNPKSQTLGRVGLGTMLPPWVRYVVDVVSDLGKQSVCQAFSSKPAAERWARAMADAISPDLNENGCASMWVTLGAVRRCSNEFYRMSVSSGGVQWYRTLDHGGKVVKNHEIDRGYHGCTLAA